MCRVHDWKEGSQSTWDRAWGLGTRDEATVEKWDAEKTAEFYKTVSGEAGRIAQKSISMDFEERRTKTWAEYEAFVQKVGQGLSVETARGIDVIAFVHGDWIGKHSRNCRTTVGKEKKKVPSASAIEGVISQLAKTYSMKGRADAENPAKEESVLSYTKGYRNDLHDRGVREKRAKLMKEGKVNELINHLSREIEKAEGIGKVVLMMDRAAI
jgi:hypothetical protein